MNENRPPEEEVVGVELATEGEDMEPAVESEDSKENPLTPAEIVANRMKNTGEYIKDLATRYPKLGELISEGAGADYFLGLQPSILGNADSDSEGNPVVNWGGEGGEVAQVLTEENIKPLFEELFDQKMKEAMDGEPWEPALLKQETQWDIPCGGDSTIGASMTYHEGGDHKLLHSFIQTKRDEFVKMADTVLESLREEIQQEKAQKEDVGDSGEEAPADQKQHLV